MFKQVSFLLVAILISGFAFAAKVKVVSGNPAVLKGQKVVLVEYDYSNMSVGKFKKEEDYLKKKSAEYNEKEAGKGDAWKEAWVNDRAARFEPKFEELLNKNLDKKLKVSSNTSEAKYKMVVHTVFTEPGFNIMITKRPALVNMIIDIVEIESGKTVGKITVDKATGATFGYGDLDTGVRIAEAYAKAGKDLGSYLNKKVLK